MTSAPFIFDLLDRRPLLITLAGPNGAGKSTFYRTHLIEEDLLFVNADIIASEEKIDAYAAAKVASDRRVQYIAERKSFVFETVFSDPAGDKLAFLKNAESADYTVILAFIGVENAIISENRVAMRALKGGHDVPIDKIHSRFPRTMANLATAIRTLRNVFVYDNSELADPYRHLALFQNGLEIWRHAELPLWFERVLHSCHEKALP